ncbi:PREDICTED: BAG family molecular chaperone regulator 1 [Chrysochloris asiatica]|uniref:BAG family molecular chaperone regulator 1 n=1 Tax=Chrysochloris asiatica TaxID=185453 RepID=A0A9B0TIL8_CHRAS|nr:PREDICTED: BAG family molecular chaperone regulator 1 [Chrysochloris asiatica]
MRKRNMPFGVSRSFFRVFSSAFRRRKEGGGRQCERSRSAGLAERGGGRRPRGHGERPGLRRRALRPGRESRQAEPPADCKPPGSQRRSVRSKASGHDRSTRGSATATGARRPRVKKKVQVLTARSDEMAKNKEMAGSEMARGEEMTQSEETAWNEETTKNVETTPSEETVTESDEMAATGLDVTVTHSNEKYDLHVTPQQGTGEPVVQDLAQLVEEATGVLLPFQKLIFKGKSLKEMEQPLSSLGIQSGCRVMLIGKKNNPEEEVELKKLKDLEKAVEKIADQLGKLSKDFAGIQQGFLAKDLQAEALCKLDKRVKATIEQFMKILEEIDTLILPENFKDSRLKRKGLVTKVQAFLAECDTVEQNICQETERLQSTNLALAD